MNVARWLLIFSFCYISFLIYLYIPEQKLELNHLTLSEILSAIVNLISPIAICAWPWLLGFSAASKAQNHGQVSIFAVLTVFVASLFLLPKYTGPEEGIGYQIVFMLLFCWCIYPFSLLFRQKN